MAYIGPVEFDGDIFKILSLTFSILNLASFGWLKSSTTLRHIWIKSFQTPFKHASRMTFLLQTQKLIMSNAWNLTKFIRGHDSDYRTPAALYVESCYCLRKRWSLRVMTSDQLCQVPSILHKKFLCLQQKCHPQCMFIWSLKGFYSNMFPSGGALNSLKWGQNEDVTASS